MMKIALAIVAGLVMSNVSMAADDAHAAYADKKAAKEHGAMAPKKDKKDKKGAAAAPATPAPMEAATGTTGATGHTGH